MRAATTRLLSRPADLLLVAAFAGVAQAEIWVFSLGNDYSIALRVTASVLTLVASGAWPCAAPARWPPSRSTPPPWWR
jgi:hypothetical protein